MMIWKKNNIGIKFAPNIKKVEKINNNNNKNNKNRDENTKISESAKNFKSKIIEYLNIKDPLIAASIMKKEITVF